MRCDTTPRNRERERSKMVVTTIRLYAKTMEIIVMTPKRRIRELPGADREINECEEFT
jgi:hypothetical protein